jgi:PAS domain S-box-containing protein
MSDKLSYEELYEQYLALQLRVTRFSATEQELINIRDTLDHELVVYKRLNAFNQKALRLHDLNEFLQLAVEFMVDIFETEAAFIYSLDDSSERAMLYSEGFRGTHLELAQRDIQSLLEKEKKPGEMIAFFQADDIPELTQLHTCLLSQALEVSSSWGMYLGLAITKEKAPLYQALNERVKVLFSIFIQQFKALFKHLLVNKENKEQLEKIAQSELELKKLSLIATKTKSGVIISDAHGQIEWVNESFEQTTGYALEEVIGKKPKEFLQDESITNHEARMKLSEALAKKQNVEVTILNVAKNGFPYYNQLQITPVFDEQGKHINFIALQKDITAEEEAKQALVKVNSRFELITQSSQIGIWEWNPETMQSTWNNVMINMFELNEEELVNCYQIFLDSIHPDDKVRTMEESNMVVTGEKEAVRHEYRIILPKSGELRFVRAMVISEKNMAGSIIRLLGSVEDVTETKLYEEKLIESNSELIKINHELDQFVYSVSHDLRSPLLSIKGLLSLIATVGENPALLQQYTQLIGVSVDRLDATILEIIDYSKNVRLDFKIEEVNVETLVKVIFDDVKHLSEVKVHFNLLINGNPLFFVDHFRFSTLLKNVISNAVKYRNKHIPDPSVEVVYTEHTDHISVRIKDNGEGISEENQQRVFDMFYRASSSSSGTGLGLYICKEMAAKLGGEINLSSEIGKGTTINLTLPKQKQTNETFLTD